MRNVVLAAIVLLLSFSGCKDKAAKKSPAAKPTPVVVAENPVTDSSFVEEAEEKHIENKNLAANDKYFLISASFQEYNNAEKLQIALSNKGMNSQIIQRSSGPNSEFYKVSYMSFSDWNEAVRTLNNERATPGKEGVWLLVKK